MSSCDDLTGPFDETGPASSVPVTIAFGPADDLYHGRLYAGFGGRWYGSDRATVERWWPEDLRVKGRVVQKPGA